MLNHPDKFGFYKVGDLKTYSKVEAIELEKRTNQTLSWCFNEDIFENIDWKIEPSIELWDMYKARARQIRNSYDYVVIWYSGGADSHNLLNAWIAADCKIDEIGAFTCIDASKDKNDYANAEHTNVVMPDMQLLKNKGFEFKFREVDISQISLDIFNRWGLNFEYYINRFFSINNPAKALLREKIHDYKDIIDSGKKLCFVWGLEKPRVSYDGSRMYSDFIDAFDNCISPYVQERFNQGWYDEAFYWTADFPLISIKQAHIVKNFIKTCNDPQYYQDSYTEYGFNPTLKKYLRVEMLKLLIYPKWSNDIFCNGKSTGNLMYSERDKWFLKSNLELKQRYDQIIKRVVTVAGLDRLARQTLKPNTSPRYYLE